MNGQVLSMTAELRDELARNNRRRLIDTRKVPARFHHLKAMGRSAAHCFDAFQRDSDDSLAMRLGAGAHAMLLGKPVVVWDMPAKKGRGKAPRTGEAWRAFEAQHRHAVILTTKEHERALHLADAVRRHTLASELLLGPGVVHERTIEWTQLGRSRRSTPDARGPTHLVELKTTRCADPDRFVRDGSYRAYHAQLADQAAAIEAETGRRPERVYIVAVESTSPYPVQVFPLTVNALEQGAKLCRLWLERLLQCEAAPGLGDWPAYCESETPFDVQDPDAVDLVFGDDDDQDDS